MPEKFLFKKEKKLFSLWDIKAYLEAKRKDFFVFLETSRPTADDKRHLFFGDPVQVFLFHPGEDVSLFFFRLEQALAQGFWLAGFFAYEFGFFLNPKLKKLCPDKTNFPLALLGVFKEPEILRAGPAAFYESPLPGFKNLRLSLNKKDYEAKIIRIKDYIASGDTYQVNFTLKYLFETEADPLAIYLALRKKQKVAFGGLLKAPGLSVISLSPELFFRVGQGKIYAKPMKGTAPRGATLAEDQEIAKFLSSDPKNQAENVMIVDLLRNDLGQVCNPGSVWVPRLFEVEKYETVHQMTSTVAGELKTTALGKILKALFPCGSVTGAPKIRTMEIIAELENAPRGVYTGAFGFISPEKEMTFNVAIRTLFLREGKGEFGIGSGIVWDSDPEKEFEECLLKAKFLTDPAIEFSLIETMKFTPGEGIRLLPFHLERLARASAYFDFPFDRSSCERFISENLAGLAFPAKIRLLLSQDGSLGLEVYELKEIKTPVVAGLAQRDFDPPKQFVYHKTTYRSWFLPWQERVRKEGLFDVIFYDEDGRLLEGTISNIFLEIDGRLYTPPAKLGLLPGVLRESLLRSQKARERELTIYDLNRAAKIYLGNAVRGLLPVKKIVEV